MLIPLLFFFGTFLWKIMLNLLLMPIYLALFPGLIKFNGKLVAASVNNCM